MLPVTPLYGNFSKFSKLIVIPGERGEKVTSRDEDAEINSNCIMSAPKIEPTI